MGFAALFDFLERLQQNNSKEWMHANRDQYVAVRDFFIHWLSEMNDELAHIDSDYFDTPPKKAINRINNNLMFHPNKPTYKDHFSAGLDQLRKQGDFYIEIGINGSFVGSGYWHPDSKTLRSIREAIDYNGEEFRKILGKPSFKRMFGDMIEDASLKTAPKGFDASHEHIELLRRKSFAVICEFSREEVQSDAFKERVIEAYIEMLPFRKYLNHAVTV